MCSSAGDDIDSFAAHCAVSRCISEAHSCMKRNHLGLSLFMIALLLVAMFPIRAYGFYVLLKFVICGGCAFLAVNAREEGRKNMLWFLGGLAVLYNPIIRFPLGREIWTAVNIVTILGLVVNLKGIKN